MLTVALRRRAQYGLQLPMLLAGGFSAVFGIASVFASQRTARSAEISISLEPGAGVSGAFPGAMRG